MLLADNLEEILKLLIVSHDERFFIGSGCHTYICTGRQFIGKLNASL